MCTRCLEKLQEFHKFYEEVLSCAERYKNGLSSQAFVKVEEAEEDIKEEEFDPEEEKDFLEGDSTSEETSKDQSKRRRRGKMIKSEVIREDKEMENFYDLCCGICNVSPTDPFIQFSTFRLYSAHMKEKHDVKVPYILCCKKKLFKRSELLDHLNYHKHPEKYQCHLCKHQCYDIYQMRKHTAKCEGGEPEEFKCDECSLTFTSINTLSSHRNVHLTREEKDQRRIHACDRCSARFTSIYRLNRHYKERHEGISSFLCHGCAKSFYSKSDFLVHYKSIHAPVTKVKCPECSSILKHERALKRHLRNMHQSKGPWICKQCNKETPTIEALRSHERYSHSDAIKLHKCHLCDKKFKKLMALREHVTTHYDEKRLHACQYCEKTFNSGANMIKHRKRMHPVDQ